MSVAEEANITKIFAQLAKTACQAFPRKLERFAVTYEDEAEPIFSTPRIEASTISDERKSFIRTALASYKKYGPSFPLRGTASSSDLHGSVIIMPHTITTRIGTYEAIYCFLHELGHLIVKGGYGEKYTHPHHESAADAFAGLMLLRFFPERRAALKAIKNEKALNIIFDTSPIHYTADTLQAVFRARNVASLSMANIVTMAGNIAKKTKKDEKDLAKISFAFRQAALTAQRETGFVNLNVARHIAAAAREHANDKDIQRAAARFFSLKSVRQKGLRQARAISQTSAPVSAKRGILARLFGL